VENWEESVTYCTKEETRVGISVTHGLPKPLKLINPQNFYPWQKQIHDLLKTEPDGKTVHWYWDAPGGKGKSSFSKYLAVTGNGSILIVRGGKMADLVNIVFNHTEELEMVIWDLPRETGSRISHSAIECVLDGMITNTKYETGTKVFNPPHVIVFANAEPDRNGLSERRWHVTEI